MRRSEKGKSLSVSGVTSLIIAFALIPCFILAKQSSEDAKKNILRISMAVDFANLDPAMATSVEDADILEQIYERLTEYDPKTALPVPGCAERWKVSRDLTKYTFYLRKDAKWSDGSDLKAGDFVFAWRRILTKKNGSPWAYMLFNIKNAEEFYSGKLKSFEKVGIRAKNDKTLVVSLNKPQPYFLAWLSHASMSPFKYHVVGRNLPFNPGLILSNGPFIMLKRKPKESVVLAGNRFYWDKDNVFLHEVHFIPTSDENTGIRMYETGLLDIHAGGISSSKYPSLLKRNDIYSTPYFGNYFYRFNTRKKPFDEVKVRKAFNLAIDKRVITDKILRGGQIPAHNLIPPGIDWYDTAKGDKFDPKRARDLLDSAGFCVPDRLKVTCRAFPKVEILFNTQTNHKLIAQAVQSMLKDNLGIGSLKLLNTDFKTSRAKEKNGDFFISRGGWAGDYLDPSTFLYLWKSGSGNNRTGWSSKEYEHLLEESDSTGSLKKRAKLLKRCESILNDEAPFMPIYFYTKGFLKKDYVKGYYPNLLSKHPLKAVHLAR